VNESYFGRRIRSSGLVSRAFWAIYVLVQTRVVPFAGLCLEHYAPFVESSSICSY